MTPILTPPELHDLTGYSQPDKVLAELHRRGFWRAYVRSHDRVVVLERPHYEAVCAGRAQEPKVKLRLEAA